MMRLRILHGRGASLLSLMAAVAFVLAISLGMI
jgi:hypothetical protein